MKRIMTEFKIDEISAVDVPAQEHAKALILKNALLNRSDKFAKEIDPMAEPDNFDEAVALLRRTDRLLKHTAALSLARERYPALFRKAQRLGESQYDRAIAKMRRLKGDERSAAVRFAMLVDRHLAKNGGSKTDALRAVRAAYPQDFEALQSCFGAGSG